MRSKYGVARRRNCKSTASVTTRAQPRPSKAHCSRRPKAVTSTLEVRNKQSRARPASARPTSEKRG
eukprot:1260494-Prymnesium_polylepis.1